MKKIVVLAMLVVFGLTANAQTKTGIKKVKKAVVAKVETPKAPAVEGAGMLFDSETVDYGTIEHKANGERQFTFVNNGNKPLIITAATGSCGCTVPTYPKEPIAPGAKAVIGVKYDTNRGGQFTKTVTVKSNAVQGESKTLTIKGNVLQPVTPAGEPTKS